MKRLLFYAALFSCVLLTWGETALAAPKIYNQTVVQPVLPGQALEEAQQLALLKVRSQVLQDLVRQLSAFPVVQAHQLSALDLQAIVLSVSRIDQQDVQPVIEQGQVAMRASLRLQFDIEDLAARLKNPYDYQTQIDQYRQLLLKENQQIQGLAELNTLLEQPATPESMTRVQAQRQRNQVNAQALTWFEKGMAALGQRDYAKAQVCFENAIRFQSDFAEAYLSRGIVFKGLGNSTAALADYETALRLNPQLVSARMSRAMLFLSRKQYDRALGDYNALLAQSHSPSVMGSLYASRGLVRHLQGQADAAIADYTQAIRLHPEDSQLPLLNRAALWQKRGDLAAALADYDQVMALDSTWLDLPVALSARADVLLALQRPAEALRDLEKAVTMPEFDKAVSVGLDAAEVYAQMGRIHLLLGQALPAVRTLSKALEIKPDQAGYYALRSQAYTLLGNCFQAQQDAKLACKWGDAAACSAQCAYE
ncbi:MAG: tetratricopeptide repeat protein [Candidatus Sericytochromatia bacterium]